MEKDLQKNLNNAFIATLGFVGFSIFALIVLNGTIVIEWYGYVELVIFPILGFMVMKGNKTASIALLVLFIIDRILASINLIKYFSPQYPFQIITPIIITFIFWNFFYRAYIAIKINERNKKSIS